MATVAKEFTFEAAHRLTSREAGACSNLHGHSYRVRVVVEGPIDSETGMVMNFRELNVAERWDHTLILNRCDPLVKVLFESGVGCDPSMDACHGLELMDGEPTAENIACQIFKEVTEDIEPILGVLLESVSVWETQKCCATVTRGDVG